jgi:hypothetical protein
MFKKISNKISNLFKSEESLNKLKSEYKKSITELNEKYNYKLSESHLQEFKILTSPPKCNNEPFKYYPSVQYKNILCSIKSFNYIPKYDEVDLEGKSTLNFASFYLHNFTSNGVDLNHFGTHFMNIINDNIKIRNGESNDNNTLPTDYANLDIYQMCFLIYKPQTYEILIAALVNLPNLITSEPEFKYYINLIEPQPQQKIYAYMGLKELFEKKIRQFGKAYKEYSDKANAVDTTKFMIKKRNKYLKYKNKYLKLKNILLKNELN